MDWWLTASADARRLGRNRPESSKSILDIDLPVVVRFGRTEMPIRALSRPRPGIRRSTSGRSPDDPVQVLVGDRVVAHGEVVIVGGNYGVRITRLSEPVERARSMEA